MTAPVVDAVAAQSAAAHVAAAHVASGWWQQAVHHAMPGVLLTVAAIRLARPNSPWAKRCYPADSTKLQRAIEQTARHDAYRQELLTRWQNSIPGAPSSDPDHRDRS